VAAQLFNCTVVEQWPVIFLWREGVKTSEIYRRILAQYGEPCMAQKGSFDHQNAHPHSEAATVQAVRQLKF
jgi:hypothetical protein